MNKQNLSSIKFGLREFFPENTKFKFLRFKLTNLVFCIFLMLATFIGLFLKPLNFGIDFTGGILFELKLPEQPNIGEMRKVLSHLNIGEINIQTIGDDNEVMIRAAIKDSKQQKQYVELIKQTIIDKISNKTEFRKVEYVGAEIGDEMIYNSAFAILFTFIGIVMYIWYRFNWQYSIGILVSLLHDVILTIGFLWYAQYEFNATSIAAILTILGYSVNDTVVVYDRIRENVHKLNKLSLEDIINLSLNETLSRTLLTVLTTLLAAGVLIIFGGESLFSFSVTVFIGIVIGTYSSIFIAAPVLLLFQKKKC
jgi:preprotein translocase subunit SecF